MINRDVVLKWLHGNLVNVVIIIVFIVVAMKVSSAQRQEIEQLTQQKDEEYQKNDELTAISQSEKQLKKSMRLVNNKRLDGIIDDINMKAAAAGISIQQINPRPEEKLPGNIYKKYAYELTVYAPGYHAIGAFVNVLEQSDALYSVDSLVFHPEFEPRRNKFRVAAQMTVSTLWLVE